MTCKYMLAGAPNSLRLRIRQTRDFKCHRVTALFELAAARTRLVPKPSADRILRIPHFRLAVIPLRDAFDDTCNIRILNGKLARPVPVRCGTVSLLVPAISAGVYAPGIVNANLEACCEFRRSTFLQHFADFFARPNAILSRDPGGQSLSNFLVTDFRPAVLGA